MGYTIIAGDRNPVYSVTSKVVEMPSRWIPQKIANWWGFRHVKNGLEKTAAKLADHKSTTDGPVTVASTQLEGVTDHVLVHTDHAGIVDWVGNKPPLAWDIIRDRLGK